MRAHAGGASGGERERSRCPLHRHLARGWRQVSLGDDLLCARRSRELHQAAQGPARFRSYLVPRSESQPVPSDPAYRCVLAHARPAQGNAEEIAAVPRRVPDAQTASRQDRCTRRGRCLAHPRLVAERLSARRALPPARQSLPRRRSIDRAALSPQPSRRRNLQRKNLIVNLASTSIDAIDRAMAGAQNRGDHARSGFLA